MKKVILVLFSIALLLSCKKETNSQSSQETASEEKFQLIQGDFIYYGDAAVLQTNKEIYGVVVNEKMHELDALVKKHKKEVTDMVPVQIRGEVTSKPQGEEGWKLNIDIKEILSVLEPKQNTNDIIKIGDK